MSERLREQMSAFMDGEAIPESSLGQLLDSPEMKASWSRYHLARDAMQNELRLPAFNLAERISAAIEAEPTVLAPKPKKTFVLPAIFKQAASLAVAASVTAVVIVGAQHYQGQSGEMAVPTLAEQSTAPAPVSQPVVQAPPIIAVAPLVQAASARMGQNAPADARQERLRAYLLDHHQQSSARGLNGMLPHVNVMSQPVEERAESEAK